MPVCSWDALTCTCVLMAFVEVTPKQALTIGSRSSEILVALGDFRVRPGNKTKRKFYTNKRSTLRKLPLCFTRLCQP